MSDHSNVQISNFVFRCERRIASAHENEFGISVEIVKRIDFTLSAAFSVLFVLKLDDAIHGRAGRAEVEQ